jgi:hypothetical protein
MSKSQVTRHRTGGQVGQPSAHEPRVRMAPSGMGRQEIAIRHFLFFGYYTLFFGYFTRNSYSLTAPHQLHVHFGRAAMPRLWSLRFGCRQGHLQHSFGQAAAPISCRFGRGAWTLPQPHPPELAGPEQPCICAGPGLPVCTACWLW